MKIYQVSKGVFCAVCGSNREALELDSAMMGTGISNCRNDSGWRRWFTLDELPKVTAVLRFHGLTVEVEGKVEVEE